MKRIAAFALAAALAGCAAHRPAPVSERTAPPVAVEAPAPAPEPAPEVPVPTHVVKRGETLVGIALQHGLDYR
ncbi:MAG: LysM peptidoglycan-binding domain-containing protein, partial [Usitatibacter sp.]